MPATIGIFDSTSGNVAKVNDAKELLVALSATADTAGFAKMLDGEGDPLLATEHGYLNVSTDDMVFVEQVDGSSLNTNKWLTSTATMTITQDSGFIKLNANATTAATNYAVLTSIRVMPMFSYLPLKISFNAYTTQMPQANATVELGLGNAATSAAPTDGVFFRWNAAGEFRGIISTGGVETISPALTIPPINNATLFNIIIVEDLAQFYVNDDLVASVIVPPQYAYPTASGRLPLFARVYTSGGSAAAAPQLFIGQCLVALQGLSQNKPWDETMAALGLGSYQSPLTAFGQTANHANSTSPASGALSNTVASYTTLGGRFQFAAPASAATDFALFAFQVPIGYQLYVKRVVISTINTGAVGGATGTILDWSVGANASAASLATVDGSGTWAPRRVPIGLQAFPITVVIAAMANDLSRNFETPLVVDGGRFFHIIVQVPLGTATASQIFRGDVMINGYFE